jgi:hypothetical protein
MVNISLTIINMYDQISQAIDPLSPIFPSALSPLPRVNLVHPRSSLSPSLCVDLSQLLARYQFEFPTPIGVDHDALATLGANCIVWAIAVTYFLDDVCRVGLHYTCACIPDCTLPFSPADIYKEAPARSGRPRTPHGRKVECPEASF